MIVRENDPPGRKWKYWFLELLSSLLVLVVCLGIPLLVLFKSEYPIFGAVLLFLMLYVAGKINCVIENHIGIAMSNWNPNRANLIQWPPDAVPSWMKPKNTRPTDPAVSSRSGKKEKGEVLREKKQSSERKNIMKFFKDPKNWRSELAAIGLAAGSVLFSGQILPDR